MLKMEIDRMEKKEMPDLTMFTGTGTETYWKWTPFSIVVLTDGVKYMVDTLEAGWLISKVDYFLMSRKKIQNKYTISVELEVNSKGKTKLTLKDDFETYATYSFGKTNFPQPGITLIAGFYDRHWILTLPAEY